MFFEKEKEKLDTQKVDTQQFIHLHVDHLISHMTYDTIQRIKIMDYRLMNQSDLVFLKPSGM